MSESSDMRPAWMAPASRWLLALGIAGSALAVGTVHTITLCVVTAVLAVAAVLGWWGAEPMRARAPATLLLFTGIGLTGYTALQCVPMPIGWLAVIAPHNADVWSRALAPLHEGGPSWAPITLDPIATRVEVLKGVAYLLAFVTALRVARKRKGVAFLSSVIVATGLVMALAAALHPAFGARRLFGLFEPGPGIVDRHIAPLMNPNNLAGYLTLALCLALAGLLAPEPRIPRAVAATAVILLVAAQIWVASRGGVIATVLGVTIVIAVARLSRTHNYSGLSSATVAAGLALVVGAALFVLSGADDAVVELFDKDLSKLGMFRETIRSVPSMPFLGCGRGAFESAFCAFRTTPGYSTYVYPENVLAQWIVEWGIPVGALALAACAYALRPSAVLARSTTAGGAWGGLVALAVQNLADLGTEIPGLMLGAIVCAAIVVGGSHGNETRWRLERWARRPTRVALAGAAAAVGALTAVARVFGAELHDDQKVLFRAVEAHAGASQCDSLARAAMLRHPAEPYLPFITALRSTRERDGDPIPWIGATFERAQVYAPAHLLLARLVSARSRSQARLEYRLAIEQAPELMDTVMVEAPRLVDGYFDASELVPDTQSGVPILERLARATDARLPATRVRLDRELVARMPAARGPALRLARDAVDDIEARDGAPWCEGFARAQCVGEALARSFRLQQMHPDACDGYALHARARVANGDVAGGVEELEKVTGEVADRVSCLKELVLVERLARNDARVEMALHGIVSAGCGNDDECAQNLRWVAYEYESNGQPGKALALYKRAFDLKPEDSSLAHLAELAAGGGLHAEAAADYDQLFRRHPEDARWHRLASEQRDAAMREAERL